MRRLICVVAVLTMTATATAFATRQWIAVSSEKPAGTGEHPAITVRTAGFDHVALHAYKVADPVQLLRKLYGANRSRPIRIVRAVNDSEAWKPLDQRVPHLKNGTALAAEWEAALELLPKRREDDTTETPMYSGSVAVPVTDKGLFLIEVRNGNTRAYTVVSVSDIVLIARNAPDKVHLYVADMRTGAPVPNCQVVRMTRTARRPERPVYTDRSGRAELRPATRSALLVAVAGQDLAVVDSTNWLGQQQTGAAYVYTDRPIYRPGDTVHFKALFRDADGNSWRVPKGIAASITITADSDLNDLFHKDFRTSKIGGVSGELVLPADLKLGGYLLRADIHQSNPRNHHRKPKNDEQEAEEEEQQDLTTGGWAQFQVQEYKKPDIEVRVTAEKDRIVQGEELSVMVDARYYFGQQVKFAKVDYAAYALDWGQDRVDEVTERSGIRSLLGHGYQSVVKGSGVLDQHGQLKFTMTTAAAQPGRDQQLLIQARVTDEAGRTITGQTSLLAIYGTFRLNIRPKQYFNAAGVPTELYIYAADYDEQPIVTPYRIELLCYDKKTEKYTPVSSLAGKTSQTGTDRLSFKLDEPGSYQIHAVAVDDNGRKIGSTTWLTVLGGTASHYAFREREPILLIPDRKGYAPGDYARLLFVSEKEGLHYFVTVEAGVSTESYELNATGTSAELDLVIKPEYAPNFYVHALAVQNGETYRTQRYPPPDFAVALTEHELKIEVEPSKGFFEPGEDTTVTVRTKTADGKPASAELSLGVVDKAIYALRPDQARNALATFYPERGSHTDTGDSLTFRFTDPVGESAGVMGGIPSGIPGGVVGGGPATPDAFVEPRVRRDFPDTAYWIADLQTDEHGEATVRFRMPDTLTTWRTTARGITEDTKVGSTVNDVISRKNVLLRLSAPRFLRTGDEVGISAFVHNYLAMAKKARISLDVTGADVVSGSAKDIEIPSGGDAKVSWTVRATSAGKTKLLAKALTDEESDAIENTIPVYPLGTRLREGHSGILRTGSPVHTEILAFPAESSRENRKIIVQIAPSVAGASLKALEFLTSYPYGCTEQTISSLVPNISVSTALKQLGIKSDVDEKELHKKVSAGLMRLYKSQHRTGGWGWWPDDPDHPFMTAYVVAGLSQARAAGYKVNAEVLERGREWLIKYFDMRVSAEQKAYWLYAITLDKPDQALLDRVWDNRASLSTYGTALLGMALQAAHDPRADQLIRQLESAAEVTNLQAYWAGRDDPLMDIPGSNDIEATAFVVQFLSGQNPRSELLPKAVAWLMEHRDQGNYWRSTKQTAIVLFALTEYLKSTGELHRGTAADLYLNDTKIGAYSLNTPSHMGEAISVELEPEQLMEGQNRVRLEMKGSGPIYWSISSEYFTSADAPQSNGLKVEREYRKLERVRLDDSWELLLSLARSGVLYTSKPLQGTAELGDIIAVKVTVSGDRWKYLMVEDPIPAGTELMESTSSLNGVFDYSPFYVGHEYHDDRASFFRTMFAGSGQFIYFLRVINPGKFGISPASAQTMYQPDVFSTTHVDRLTVN